MDNILHQLGWLKWDVCRFCPSTVLGSQIYSKTRDNDLLIKIVLVRARCTASMLPIASKIDPTPWNCTAGPTPFVQEVFNMVNLKSFCLPETWWWYVMVNVSLVLTPKKRWNHKTCICILYVFNTYPSTSFIPLFTHIRAVLWWH